MTIAVDLGRKTTKQTNKHQQAVEALARLCSLARNFAACTHIVGMYMKPPTKLKISSLNGPQRVRF